MIKCSDEKFEILLDPSVMTDSHSPRDREACSWAAGYPRWEAYRYANRCRQYLSTVRRSSAVVEEHKKDESAKSRFRSAIVNVTWLSMV